MTQKERMLLKQLELSLAGLEEIAAAPVPKWVTDTYAYKCGWMKAYMESHLKDMIELIQAKSK